MEKLSSDFLVKSFLITLSFAINIKKVCITFWGVTSFLLFWDRSGRCSVWREHPLWATWVYVMDDETFSLYRNTNPIKMMNFWCMTTLNGSPNYKISIPSANWISIKLQSINEILIFNILCHNSYTECLFTVSF